MKGWGQKTLNIDKFFGIHHHILITPTDLYFLTFSSNLKSKTNLKCELGIVCAQTYLGTVEC